MFDVSIDDLIKGDVETMTKTIERDAQTFKKLGYVMTGFLLLMLAALIWLTLQVVAWDWPLEQSAPTLVLALTLWGIAMFAAVWAERIKKEHDLVTYSEVCDFWSGKSVDRGTERGRRERMIPLWMKVIRSIGFTLIAAAIGAFLGYNGAALANMLFG